MKPQSAVRALRARPIAVLAALFAFAALTNALIAGCGGNSGSSSSTETQAPSSEATQSTGGTSEEGSAMGSSDALAEGKQIYEQRCVLCHGASGKGDGPAAAGLNPKPRNHTDGEYMDSRTNEELIEVVTNGKGAMPAWGNVLTESQIHAVLRYVRSMAVPAYQGPMP